MPQIPYLLGGGMYVRSAYSFWTNRSPKNVRTKHLCLADGLGSAKGMEDGLRTNLADFCLQIKVRQLNRKKDFHTNRPPKN